jgi:hypothetical protein
LRGFAKCWPAAADTRPGLMPQNTTARPGASTSGTALGGFGLAGVEPELEETAELFTGDRGSVPGPLLLWDRHDPNLVVAISIATGVALGLGQLPEPPHGPYRKTAAGRHS